MRRLTWILALIVFGGGSVALWSETAEKKPPARDETYGLYQLFVDAFEQIERNYAVKVDRRELMESALRGMIERLDPYSNYIGPQEIDQFRAAVESEFGGIGVQITMDDGQLKILSPLYGTPAYRAGLLAGDRIVEINGQSTEGLSLDEATKRMKGDVGASVTLGVIHPGGDEKVVVTLKRELIHVETVLGNRRDKDGRWDYFLDPDRKIGYVRVTVFGRDTAESLRQVLGKLQAEKMRGLILDLRFNPGGLLGEAVDVSDLFIGQGRIVSTKGRNSPEQIWEAHQPGTFLGFPIAVLVNRFSASASEIVAACLQDHRRAAIVGQRTWGKGSVQSILELENGKSALKLTTASYFRSSGKNIHRFPDAKETDQWGVLPDPDWEVKLDERETAELLDAQRHRDVLRAPKKEKDAKEKKEKPFVDRQLEAAVKYLEREMGGKGAKDKIQDK
ncbi:MAG: S41 family peptidase [Pirellulales bacterium]|nr:S41 family peptidase [Pirellulales bacterium]